MNRLKLLVHHRLPTSPRYIDLKRHTIHGIIGPVALYETSLVIRTGRVAMLILGSLKQKEILELYRSLFQSKQHRDRAADVSVGLNVPLPVNTEDWLPLLRPPEYLNILGGSPNLGQSIEMSRRNVRSRNFDRIKGHGCAVGQATG